MREIAIVAGLLSAVALPANAETRNATGFETVKASGDFDVEIAVGENYRVDVSGADAARIRTRVVDGELRIEPARRSWFGEPRYDARINVTLPRFEGVAAARGATVRATAGGECADFSAVAAMGADLEVNGLQCDSVNATAAMGAELRLAGQCGTLDASAAMGAELNARALQCRTVDASAAMGAEVAAYASASYDASAAMGGDISVAGGGTGDRSTALGGAVTQQR
jgi:hypothetical protein